MRFPWAGRLESGALVRTIIQCCASQALAGSVKTPVKVAPAASGDNSYETDMALPFRILHRGERGRDFDQSVSVR